jgi:hypothetical protein
MTVHVRMSRAAGRLGAEERLEAHPQYGETPAVLNEVVHGAGNPDGFDIRITELPKGAALPLGRVLLWDEVDTGQPS